MTEETESKPLLILDLDETLLHSSKHALAQECDLRFGKYYVYYRPYAQLFLQTVAEEYNLACWSSATAGYLQELLRSLMSGQENDLLFVWDRRRCTRAFDPDFGRHYFVKDLKKVKRRGFDLKRVLILEDEPRKVKRSYGNAIYVKPFEGNLDDDELLRLAQYLIAINKVSDFRRMEKRSWRSNI